MYIYLMANRFHGAVRIPIELIRAVEAYAEREDITPQRAAVILMAKGADIPVPPERYPGRLPYKDAEPPAHTDGPTCGNPTTTR